MRFYKDAIFRLFLQKILKKALVIFAQTWYVVSNKDAHLDTSSLRAFCIGSAPHLCIYLAIFFIYLLIIYPACPARDKKSDDPTCTGHRFFFLYLLCADRSGFWIVSCKSVGVYGRFDGFYKILIRQRCTLLRAQKSTRKAPATFEAREARIKGCSPLIIPKQKGSIQKS